MRIVIKPLGAIVLLIAVLFLGTTAVLKSRRGDPPPVALSTPTASALPEHVVAANLLKPTGVPANWGMDLTKGAAATLTAGPEGELQIKILHSTGVDWHIQVYQKGLDIHDGDILTLRYKARSEPAQSLKVWGSVDQTDFHEIWPGWGTMVDYTPQWRDYEYRFVAARTVPKHSRVPVFALGQMKGTLSLKDVTLEVRRR